MSLTWGGVAVCRHLVIKNLKWVGPWQNINVRLKPVFSQLRVLFVQQRTWDYLPGQLGLGSHRAPTGHPSNAIEGARDGTPPSR
jgi:hypothetical protein